MPRRNARCIRAKWIFEARLQLFIAFPFRFPADKGREESWRSREREKERGGDCERLDYSGEEKEKGAASFSLAFSEKKRCLK